MVATIVTYLEMTSPPQAADAPLPAGYAFHRHTHAAPDWYRGMFRAVGEDWLWLSRLKMDDDALTAVLHHPDYELWTLQHHGADVGLVEIDHRTADTSELAFFGLIPAAVGKGLGRAMMGHALSRGFSRPIQRMHLHTCTFDSPQALGFYRRSGFKIILQKVEVAEDPRLAGQLPITAAAHIPVLK
nr:GNAT family N-acetyltransferase [Yoonia sp. I 8.24]